MKEKLPLKTALVLGGALFSMHFGASCMLYPVTWGKESGNAVWIAYLGIFLSAVLLPLMGYTALSLSEKSFLETVKQAAPKFGLAFCLVLILINGPIYIIPRMSAAAWEAVVQLFSLSGVGRLPVILFNIVYYVICYWFLSSRSKIMDRLGSILFPVLIIVMLAVVIKGCVQPIASTRLAPSYDEPPFVYGFLQGYATADLLCSLMFGVVIINQLRNHNIGSASINKNMVLIGVIGLGLLAFTHLGHMLVGAGTGGTIDLTLSALYAEVVLRLWGRAGGMIFMVALVAASMSTAVGIGAACSEYIGEVLGWRYKYNHIVLAVCAVSLIVSCVGLNSMIVLMGPLLDACYPGAIVLAIYYSFMPKFTQENHLRGLKYSMIVATILASLHLVYALNGAFHWQLSWYDRIYLALPLAKLNFAWLPGAAIAFIVGCLFPCKSNLKKA